MQIRTEDELLELDEPVVLKQAQKILLDASSPGDGENVWLHISNKYTDRYIGTFELPIEDARHFAKQIERSLEDAANLAKELKWQVKAGKAYRKAYRKAAKA